MEENIISELWDDLDNNKIPNSINLKNWMNEDNLDTIILNDKVFWFELTSSFNTMPDTIYRKLVKWGESKGYTYLYNIKEIA